MVIKLDKLDSTCDKGDIFFRELTFVLFSIVKTLLIAVKVRDHSLQKVTKALAFQTPAVACSLWLS